MAKIFITGIGGFVGRNIAEEAVRQGYRVSGCDRSVIRVRGATVVKADIRDRKAMLRLTKGIDYVIHVAALTSNLEFEKRTGLAYDVNVNGFDSVVDAAATNRCKKFLYASSSAVYSDEFSEDAVIDISRMTNHYAKTKLMNEAVARSYKSLGLLNAVGMRFFNVYGQGENDKGDYASIVTLFMKYKKAGKQIVIYGDGKQRRDLIYVRDVAKIALLLLKKGDDYVYNIGTGRATSYNEIADMVAEGKKKHVSNPLSTYQLLTKADTRRLLGAIKNFKFTSLAEGVSMLLKDQ